MAWPNSQARRVAQVIQNAQVSGTGTHSALIVTLTRANIPNEMCSPTDGNRAQSDAGDIRAATGNDGTGQIPIDVIHWEYDTTDGAGDANIEIKVKLDVATASDTTFYLAYNTAGTTSADAAGDTFGRNAVYSGCEVALVMESTTPVDRSGNHTITVNTGAEGPQLVTDTPFGTALEFDTDDSLSNTDAALKDIPTTYDFTVEVIARRAGGTTSAPVVAWDGADDLLLYPFDGATPNFRVFWRDLGGNILSASNGGVSSDWLWVALTSRASNDHESYVDGASHDTSAATGTAGAFSSFNVGRWPGGQSFLDDIAQVIVWKTARSSDWIATRYNNESSPATFIVEGTPEDVGGGATPEADPKDRLHTIGSGFVGLGDSLHPIEEGF